MKHRSIIIIWKLKPSQSNGSTIAYHSQRRLVPNPQQARCCLQSLGSTQSSAYGFSGEGTTIMLLFCGMPSKQRVVTRWPKESAPILNAHIVQMKANSCCCEILSHPDPTHSDFCLFSTMKSFFFFNGKHFSGDDKLVFELKYWHLNSTDDAFAAA